MNTTMHYFTAKTDKIKLIQSHFQNLISHEITGYGLPQCMFAESHEWEDWMDLPLRLVFGSHTLSISWMRCGDLAIASGNYRPSRLGTSKVRWVNDGIESLSPILGMKLKSVALGYKKDEIYDDGTPSWQHLILTSDQNLSFDLYAAGDENAFKIYTEKPDIKTCICCS
ncbi:hypothetical protein [Kiloniella litopenaei]|nr:hypothetical protein [Kiloniella litopenaei]